MAELTPENLQITTEYIERDLKQLRRTLDQLYDIHDEYSQTHQRLSTLPDKVQHAAMIPFGSKAFVPGFIVNTNEVTVYLGADHYTDVTVKHAVGIVERRMNHLQDDITRNQEMMKDICTQYTRIESLFRTEDIFAESSTKMDGKQATSAEPLNRTSTKAADTMTSSAFAPKASSAVARKPLIEEVETPVIPAARATPARSAAAASVRKLDTQYSAAERLRAHVTGRSTSATQSAPLASTPANTDSFTALPGMPVPRSFRLQGQGANEEGLPIVEIVEEVDDSEDLVGNNYLGTATRYGSVGASSDMTQAQGAAQAEDTAQEMLDTFMEGFDAQYHAQYSQYTGQRDVDGEFLDSLYPDVVVATTETSPAQTRKLAVEEEDDEGDEVEEEQQQEVSVSSPRKRVQWRAQLEQLEGEEEEEGEVQEGEEQVEGLPEEEVDVPPVDFEALWAKLDVLEQARTADVRVGAAVPELPELPDAQVTAVTDTMADTAKSIAQEGDSSGATAGAGAVGMEGAVDLRSALDFNMGMGLSAAMAQALALLDEEEDEDYDDGGFYAQYAHLLGMGEGDEDDEVLEEDEDVEGVVVGAEDEAQRAFAAYGAAQSRVRVVDDEQEEDDIPDLVTTSSRTLVNGARSGGAEAVDDEVADDDEYAYGYGGDVMRRSRNTAATHQRVFGTDNPLEALKPRVDPAPAQTPAQVPAPTPILKSALKTPVEPVPAPAPAVNAFTGVVAVREKPKKQSAAAQPTQSTQSTTPSAPAAAVQSTVAPISPAGASVVPRTRARVRDSLSNRTPLGAGAVSVQPQAATGAVYQSVTMGASGQLGTLTTEGLPVAGANGTLLPADAPKMSKFKAKRLGLLSEDE